MRAYVSYGIALLIVLGLAVWLGSGVLIQGGQGPGKGEKPVVALVGGGEASEEHHEVAEGEIDPSLTIAERNDAAGGGENAKPRSVRIQISTAQAKPIEVPLRGRTKAAAAVSVVAQTSGTVQAVGVTKGQSVKAGDLLCTLDQGARQAAVAQAQASVDQAQSSYDANAALREKGLAAENSGLPLEAALKGAQAALQNAQLELARTEIKAPVDGVVADPLATVGSMLAPGAPCASVVQLDPMLFVAAVPEARIAYARLGLNAVVTTVTGDKADGTVTYLSPTADEATRSFAVEISLPNPDHKLRDGVTADAIVNVGTATVHILPQSVLTLDDKGVLGIRTVEEGNKVAFYPANIIKDSAEGVWLIDLPFKINVITVGQDFVQPGQVVDAKTAEGEQPS